MLKHDVTCREQFLNKSRLLSGHITAVSLPPSLASCRVDNLFVCMTCLLRKNVAKSIIGVLFKGKSSCHLCSIFNYTEPGTIQRGSAVIWLCSSTSKKQPQIDFREKNFSCDHFGRLWRSHGESKLPWKKLMSLWLLFPFH